MKIFNSALFLLMTMLLMSCEDVIDVDLDTAPPRLVIDASINWLKNTPGQEQVIKLSTTTGYYDEKFPSVSGAIIVVTNPGNQTFSFTEKPGTGEYTCNDFEPVIGQTYTLNISLNGENYTATETMMAAPDIEAEIKQNNTGGMGGDEVEITYYHKDNGAEENYYLYGINTVRTAFPQFSVENDENSQGNLASVYYSHKDLEPGDVVNIRLYGISKRYYDYFKKLLLASGNDDSPFPTTPTEVRGNIINTTNSKNFAYGYFRLVQLDSRDYTIQ